MPNSSARRGASVRRGRKSMSEIDKLPHTRQRIIEATINLISKIGHSEFTTTLVAKEARVSQGIIFHYFKNKEKLLLSAIQYEIERFTELAIERIGGEKDPLRKIEKVAFAYSEMAMSIGPVFQVILRRLKLFGSSAEKIEEVDLSKLHELLTGIIQSGIEQGIIRKVDPGLVVASLLGALNYNILRWLIYKGSFSLKESSRMVADILVRGIEAA